MANKRQKGRIVPMQDIKAYWGAEAELHSFVTSVRFTTRLLYHPVKEHPVPLKKRLGERK
jgi:hypothetical protein